MPNIYNQFCKTCQATTTHINWVCAACTAKGVDKLKANERDNWENLNHEERMEYLFQRTSRYREILD